MIDQIGNMFISGLELNVNLGWTKDERERAQTVFADIEIRFARAPQACRSDKLDETICYDLLTRTLRAKLSQKHFQLVERLANEIYLIIKSQLPQNALVMARVLKYPDIDGLNGGVCFSFGDF